MPPRVQGSDVSVQGTNDDAQISKLSCVNLGYFRDDFVKYFVAKPSRRSPLINRGYYSRVAALQELVGQFLCIGESEGESARAGRQVLSLGAGFDTLFFMLQSAGWAPGRYFEVDFDVVTRKKAAIIDATPALCDLVGDDRSVDKESGRVESSRYCLFPADLRDLPALQKSLVDLGFDFSLPTLVLSECVLVYMDPRYSQPIVQWAGAELPDAVFVIYEQIHPEDAFGQQMLINLEAEPDAPCAYGAARGNASLSRLLPLRGQTVRAP